MTKFTVIKPGYRITIKSWENDGDNYNTQTFEGFSEYQVRFLKPLIDLFDGDEFGNMYDPDESEISTLMSKVKDIVKNNIDYADDDWKEAVNDKELLMDIFLDVMHDFGLTRGEQFTRVLDSIKIEYIPEEIKIEDVTDRF